MPTGLASAWVSSLLWSKLPQTCWGMIGVLVGDVVEVRLRRSVEREDDLVGALKRDVGERTAVSRPQGVEVERGVGLECIKGVDHIVGAEWAAVAPLHAAADGHGQGCESVAPTRTGGQPWCHLGSAVGVGLQDVDELERLVDEPDRRDVHRWIERVELAGPGAPALVVDEQLASHLAGVARVAAAGCRRGATGRGQHSRHDHQGDRLEASHRPAAWVPVRAPRP